MCTASWLRKAGRSRSIFTLEETTYLWVIFGISLVALAFAYYLVREVLGAPEGTEKMKEIARAIQEGAKAYLSRQFRTLGIFLALLTVVLFFILPAPENAAHSEFAIKFGRSVAFILGAGFSALTGYVGMWLAVRANVRTANAARESGSPTRAEDRVPRGRRRRHVHGRARPAGRDRDPADLQGRRHLGPGRVRVRRRAPRDVHAGGRRHLHEGRRRGRRPGRQDRAGDPGGRPAQRRGDRRQRRRQRRRLRGDGSRPLRVLRGHARRVVDPRRRGVRRLRRRRDRRCDVPVVRPRRRRDHLDRRHPRGDASERDRARDEGDQPRLLPVGRDLGRGRLRDLAGLPRRLEAGRGRRDRARAGERDPGPHAVLHRHEVQAGAGDRRGDEHGAGDHDPVRLLDRARVDRVVGADHRRRRDGVLLPRRHARRAARTSSPSPAWGCSRRWASWCRWTRTGRSRTTRRASRRCRGSSRADPAEILGGLDAVGNSTKAITKGMAIATAVLAATSLFGSFEVALEAAGFDFTGIKVDEPERPGRTAARRLGRVPVLLTRDPRRRARRDAGRGGGPEPVPRPSGDHGLHARSRTTAASSTSARARRSAS